MQLAAVLFGTILGTVLLCAAPAGADPSTARAAADALFREAVGHAEAGRYDEAINKFKASFELEPARGTLQGLAMSEERAGRVLDAQTHYRQLLDLARGAGDARRVEIAEAGLAKVTPRVPMLAIVFASDVPAATVASLDGVRLPSGAIGSALPLNPGEHRVTAKAPDGRTFSLMVGLSESARTRVTVSWRRSEPLVQEVSPPPQAPSDARADEPAADGSGLRTAGLALGATGLLLAGVSAYLWVDSGNDYDEASEGCPGGECTSEAKSRIDAGRAKERWSGITLVGGVIAAGAGVTLFVLGSQKSEPRVRATLSASGVALRGRF